KRFATFNEPSVFTLLGYGFGWHAPGLTDRQALLRAIHHVNLAHGSGVDVLRTLVSNASIGAIHNYQPCLPATATDEAARSLLDALWNGAMPDPQLVGAYPALLASDIEAFQHPGDLARICQPIDWFGLNHYSPLYAKADPRSVLGFRLADPPSEKKRTGIGWAIEPDAFRATLLALDRRFH